MDKFAMDIIRIIQHFLDDIFILVLNGKVQFISRPVFKITRFDPNINIEGDTFRDLPYSSAIRLSRNTQLLMDGSDENHELRFELIRFNLEQTIKCEKCGKRISHTITISNEESTKFDHNESFCWFITRVASYPRTDPDFDIDYDSFYWLPEKIR
jgi:hypothetical protein